VNVIFEKLHHTGLTQRTRDLIRKRILTRDLATNEQIDVDKVAAQLGVSRTPVLEALKELEREELVEIRPRRGCFVRPLWANDVREIFETREAVELYCTRRAIEEARGQEVAKKLDKAMREMRRHVKGDQFLDYEAFTAADRNFHELVVASQENGRLSKIYANLNVHMHVMRVHLFQALESPTRVMVDHQRIQRALAENDWPAASAATIGHLHAICSRMVDHIVHNGGSI
jgi:DNA-binding GntR family transcriptional regulator